MTDPKSEVHHTPGGAMFIVHHSVKSSEEVTDRLSAAAAPFILRSRGDGADARIEILKLRMDSMTPLQAMELAAGLLTLSRGLGASMKEWIDACERTQQGSGKALENVHQTYTESAAPNTEPKEPS